MKATKLGQFSRRFYLAEMKTDNPLKSPLLTQSPKKLAVKRSLSRRTYKNPLGSLNEGSINDYNLLESNNPGSSRSAEIQSEMDNSGAEMDNSILTMPSPPESIGSPRRKKLKLRIAQLKQRINVKNAQNYSLKRKNLSLTTRSVLNNLLKDKAPTVKTLVYMQCFHKKRTAWTKIEKQLALSLYYKSPSNYRFMLRNLKFVLPGISTIQSWLKIFNLETGVDISLIRKLVLKVKGMQEDEKRCAVMCDEMVIKKGLDYNKFHDKIEGYEDFGSLGRSDGLGTHAIMFYLRGLLYKWKMPFCYFVAAGAVKGETLSKLICLVLNKLFIIGLKPRLFVCDQGSNNRTAIAKLGGNIDNPFILLDSKKIYVSYDPPHLLKSLRNNFMNNKLDIRVDNNQVSWSDFTKAYEIDKSSNTTRSMIKITEKHVLPTTFQRMRVKYAAQVFSHSVSAAILTAVATKQLRSDTAINTAMFLQKINNIFDCLNSRTVRDSNPYKSALSIYNEVPEKTLRDAQNYFNSIKFFEKGRLRKNIYCVEGFKWSIKATLELWENLQEEGKKYFLTSRINQDPIENAFSVIRTRGGYNPQPTVKQFRIAVQQNMQIRLQMSVEGANCESENDEMLALTSNNTDILDEEIGIEYNEDKENNVEEELNSGEEPNASEEENRINSTMQQTEGKGKTIATLETCTNTYVAGYLIHHLFKKVSCESCTHLLVKANEAPLHNRELLLLHRDYNGDDDTIKYLRRPSDEFGNIVDTWLHRFNYWFGVLKLENKIVNKIRTQLVDITNQNYNHWFEIDNYCKDHKLRILNQFIKIKLFRHLKWEIETIKPKSANTGRKPHRKVTILSS